MSYFTETMALFEFKSDIEKSNNRRLMHDLNSNQHDHRFSKMNSRDGHEFGWDVENARDKKIHDKYNKDIANQDQQYYENRKRDRANAKSNPDYAKQKAERNMARKSCKESFSDAFDSIIL